MTLAMKPIHLSGTTLGYLYFLQLRGMSGEQIIGQFSVPISQKCKSCRDQQEIREYIRAIRPLNSDQQDKVI